MQLEWSHAVVHVRNLDNMLSFYTRVLGFEVSDRGPVGGEGSPEIIFMSQIPTDHHQIAFLAAGRDENPPNSVNHFAFRVASLDDVKEMKTRLEEDGRVEKIMPLSHGNTWSIYFSDPEGNGIEVFCDSPWHVPQPQGKPWDPDKSNSEIEAESRQAFENEPGFGPISDFYEKRRNELKRR